MTKLNDIAKRTISEKFAEAVKKEGITKSEAGRLLGFLRPAEYPGMIINHPEKASCGTKPWEILQQWSNSGLSLSQYSKKYVAEHKEEPDKAKSGEDLVSSKEEQDREYRETLSKTLQEAADKDGISRKMIADLFLLDIRDVHLFLNNSGLSSTDMVIHKISIWANTGITLKEWCDQYEALQLKMREDETEKSLLYDDLADIKEYQAARTSSIKSLFSSIPGTTMKALGEEWDLGMAYEIENIHNKWEAAHDVVFARLREYPTFYSDIPDDEDLGTSGEEKPDWQKKLLNEVINSAGIAKTLLEMEDLNFNVNMNVNVIFKVNGKEIKL